jgi:hypothetical protein
MQSLFALAVIVLTLVLATAGRTEGRILKFKKKIGLTGWEA